MSLLTSGSRPRWVALTHVRVIDGTGSAPLQNSTVILSHGTIQVSHHVAVTSTLPVFETYAPFRDPDLTRILEALQPSSRADYLDVRADVNRNLGESPFWPGLLKKEMQFERDFVKAGGLLLAGVDPTGNGGNLAGFGDQREVELLVEAGFTPVQAIQIATANGAGFLGEPDHIGSLAPGKQADVVVIHGDPSTTIADIEKVEIVFKDGIGYDSAKLIKSVSGSVGLHWTEDAICPLGFPGDLDSFHGPGQIQPAVAANASPFRDCSHSAT